MQAVFEAGRSSLPVSLHTWSGCALMHYETCLWMGICSKVGPWNLGILCLQYTDDTLILLPPDLASIKRVKILLYIFELISGLSINFHKSSIYPLVPPSLICQWSQECYIALLRVSLSVTENFHLNRPSSPKQTGISFLTDLIRDSRHGKDIPYLVEVDLS